MSTIDCFEADIDGGPVAWLHDEIVLEVRADQAEQAAEILKQAMIDGFIETFPGAPINGLVEPHVATSWDARLQRMPDPDPSEPSGLADDDLQLPDPEERQ